MDNTLNSFQKMQEFMFYKEFLTLLNITAKAMISNRNSVILMGLSYEL